ncbi:hypothetical protein OEZ86_010051 [Tetradesmus obliquus]|uniref:Uncharacterized protein n=1 Tax=Tetradesmus obliquus TaxID=3088 RepID=A0ABY8UP89_TETOB|nr:hypothetical protein OEZ85_001486 [Tetradesmus obliquus]WIA43606.1 hypothetical protein OEZ86_010051 [Tetradesmus obliquus]
MSAHGSHVSSAHITDASSRIQQLRAAAKQALLRHKFQEARRILDEAVSLHPDSYKLHRLRCVASACLGDYEAALEDAEVVVELMPSMSCGYYHKGFALHQLHDYAGAAHAFQQGLDLNPTDKIMRQGFWDAVNLLSQDRPVGVALQPGLAGPAAAAEGSGAVAGGGLLMGRKGAGGDRAADNLAALLADD